MCYSFNRELGGWETSRRGARSAEGLGGRLGGLAAGRRAGLAGQRVAAAASRNTGNREKLISHGDTRRRMKMRWETGQTVMDSCNRIYHGVENEEIYLWVVVVVAGTRRFARKSSPDVRRKPSLL